MLRLVFLCRVLLLSVFCWAFGAQAYAADKVYMNVVGNQGSIEGDAKSPHGRAWIPVQQYNFSLEAPRDAATGHASGKREHEPIRVIKDMDAASPKLLQAATTGGHIKQVTFQVYRVGAGGREELYETIRLVNPIISGVHASGGGAGKSSAPQEELSFAYEEIQYNYTQQKAPGSMKAEPGLVKPLPPSPR